MKKRIVLLALAATFVILAGLPEAQAQVVFTATGHRSVRGPVMLQPDCRDPWYSNDVRCICRTTDDFGTCWELSGGFLFLPMSTLSFNCSLPEATTFDGACGAARRYRYLERPYQAYFTGGPVRSDRGHEARTLDLQRRYRGSLHRERLERAEIRAWQEGRTERLPTAVVRQWRESGQVSLGGRGFGGESTGVAGGHSGGGSHRGGGHSGGSSAGGAGGGGGGHPRGR